MKKYKLIKTYPGSPDLGSIHEGHGQDGDYITYNCHRVVALPEFWEKVIEKNYEILSFVNAAITPNPVFKKGINDKYTLATNGLSFGCLTEKYMLSKDNLKIHSVKRLSDGEIFTIGDTVNYKEGTIYDMVLNCTKNDILIGVKGCETRQYLSSVHYYKKPLFTTTDDVDIFEGDTYYQITNNFEIHTCKAYCKNNFDSSLTIFLNEEKAEEYILMNKPCLSFDEVFKLWVKCGLTIEFFDKLEETVKSKL